jgi:hypothetical protein
VGRHAQGDLVEASTEREGREDLHAVTEPGELVHRHLLALHPELRRPPTLRVLRPRRREHLPHGLMGEEVWQQAVRPP